MSHAATGIRTVPVLARRDGTYDWSYRANALTEMSLGTSVHGGQRCAGEGRGECPNRDELGNLGAWRENKERKAKCILIC